ncbi:MAG: TIGR03618 family F420-dependent PPOX class oxidoreductase [Caldilineales bacterium]|nr:TIGR03618 family F420-dependent PPOX class oxidoreductase [Caldilineales bacterium]MDW8317809.1 TIGR03618 family F420-dependent PPOX class oxidoreductase [Anaerolineae bacterium]
MTLYILVPVKRLAEAKSRLAEVLSAEERQALALRLLQSSLEVVRQAQSRLGAVGIVVSPDPAALDLAAAYGLLPLAEAASPVPAEAGSHLEGRTFNAQAQRHRGSSRALSGRSQVGRRAPQKSDQGSSFTVHRPPITVHRSPITDHRPPFTVHGSPSTDHPLNAALEQATAFAAARGASAVLILPADLPLLTLADVERLWRASQLLYAPAAVVVAPDGQEQGTNALLVRPPGALRYAFGPGSFQRHCAQARERGLACHIVRSPRLGLDVDLPADLAQWLAIERADAIPGTAHAPLETSPMHDEHPPIALDDAVVAFLNEPGLLMRLGTLGSDGYPQVTPVWYLFEEGRLLVSTTADRVKARNMRGHPKVGFAIDRDQPPYRGVTGRGLAHVVAEGEAARPITQRIVARYVPAERVDAMVEALMQAPRVVFAIEVQRMTKMGSW